MGVPYFKDHKLSLSAGKTHTFVRQFDWFQLYSSNVELSEVEFSINNDEFSTLYEGIRLDIKSGEMKRLRIRNVAAGTAELIILTGAAELTSSPLVVSSIANTINIRDVDRVTASNRFNSGVIGAVTGSGSPDTVWPEVGTPGYDIYRYLTDVSFWQEGGGSDGRIKLEANGIEYAGCRIGADESYFCSFPTPLYIPIGEGDLELAANGSGKDAYCVANGYWVKVATS